MQNIHIVWIIVNNYNKVNGWIAEEYVSPVRVHILNMGLVENTLTGNLILTVMLAFAEYERGMIVERTQTGKAVARQDPNFKDSRTEGDNLNLAILRVSENNLLST